jgi:hypothetical protein
MGAVHQAKEMQKRGGTRCAADYLKAKGYSLSSALYILTGRVL